jgi:nucleoside-diphosphate-sugar epimerase
MTTSVVTGGVGFVGQHLVEGLRARGDSVRVLDIADESPFGDDVDYRRVDITDADAVDAALEGADVVFHNASLVHTAQNRIAQVWAVNRDGAQHVIDGCKHQGVKRLVYISSGSVVYDGKDIRDGDESMPYATTSQAPYADSKIEAEKLTLAANGSGEEGGLLTCAIRPHVIFGPGDARFMPAVLRNAKAGRLKFQVGRGEWLSDYTYISNLVDALLLADEKLVPGSAVAGSAYFITNGEPMPFWGFVKDVLARLSFPPIRYKVPHQLVYGIAAVKESVDTLRGGKLNSEDGLTRFAIRYMCTHHYFDITKARRELGYDPKVSMSEGIEKTCAHLEAVGAV